MPRQDSWRIGCLKKFLAEKFQLEAKQQSTEVVQDLIDSICSS